MLHTLRETLTTGFYVMITEHLRSPYVLAEDGDLTLAILKREEPGAELVPAIQGVSGQQREAWLTPFGVPPGGNVWDYFPPDQPLDESQIRPEHRVPPEIEDRVNAYLSRVYGTYRPPEPRVP